LNPPTIPDHTLLRPIGRGAYGEVWLARNIMGALRAVKIIWRRQFEHERPFERECAGIQRFEPVSRSSGGLVHVLHVGRNEAEGYFYYVMELADGLPAPDSLGKNGAGEMGATDTYSPRTLRSDLTRRGRLAPTECLRLAIEIVSGLAQLHRQGLVHRDVKPGNIIYVQGRAKLADIGLVSSGEEGRTFVGTEGYIPPEGPGSPAADLYALGIVLYESSTGHSPEKFPDVPPEWFTEQGDSEALEFHEIILKACEAQRDRRYATAESMQADLALLQSGQSIRRARALERRYTQLRWSGIVGTILLVGALVVALFANYRAKVAAETVAKEAKLRQQAQESLARAESAEHDARRQLFTALWGEARATVRSGELGHRGRALEALRRAGSISNAVELRQEVFAALTLPDLRFERELAIGPNVTGVQCDPAFERVAISRGAAAVEVRSVADGALLASLPASTNLPTYVLLWSVDGRYLALKRDYPSGGRRADWEIWELSEAEPRRTLLLRDLLGEAISFHPRINQLFISHEGAVVRWDLMGAKEVGRFPMPREPRRLEFSRDGESFVTVHDHATNEVVSLGNVADGAVTASWKFSDFISDVRWHPGGKWLGAADHSGKVQLLDCVTGEVKVLGRHKVEAATLAFAPQGDYLISGGWEREMICWDLRTLKPAFSISMNSYHLRFSADGRFCTTVGHSPQRFAQELRLHRFERPEGFREFPEDLGSRLAEATFSPDGRWLAGSGQKRVGVWDLATNGSGAMGEHTSTGQLFFTPDGSELFTSYRNGGWRRWRIETTGGLELHPALNASGPGSICLASNLAIWTGPKGSRVEVLGRSSNESIREPTANGLTGASPDGRWLGVYPSFGNVLSIYSLPTLAPVVTITNRTAIRSFRFSPKGNELAIASQGGIQFWSTSNWQRTREYGDSVDILYTADGRGLWLTKDYRTAGLYDAATFQLLLPLPTGMLPLAVSPDGQRLAVSVDQRRLQLWDLAEVRKQLGQLGLDWQD
jgi:WD40 repeat protein